MNDQQITPSNKLHSQVRLGIFARVWRVVRILLFVICGLYFVLLGYLWWNENSLVYPGQSAAFGNWSPQGFEFAEVEFSSADGTQVFGWYLPREGAHRNVVVFHGNAENVATTVEDYGEQVSEHLNANVLAFDYRGFGKSVGLPTETVVIADGIAAVQWLMATNNVPSQDIIYYGSSIGGGVACGVAQHLPPKMLLLDRTFGDLVSPASALYPIFPVGWIMSNRYDSVARIKSFEGPVFISHFEQDELISIAEARRLFEAAPSPNKKFLSMPGGNHLAKLPLSYWSELSEFVGRYFE